MTHFFRPRVLRPLCASPPPRDPRRIAYVVSRFPKLSETFILREMDVLEELGWRIDVYPFIHHTEAVRHPEVARWLHRLDRRDTAGAIARANLAWMAKAPWTLLALYGVAIRELWRSPGELGRGLFAVARAALWARRARARGVAHVHAHFALHPAVAALAVARLAGVTFSFTGHAHDIYRTRAMLGEKVRRAAFAVVISRLLRDRYIAPLVAPADLARVRVVRCGVNTTAYGQRDRSYADVAATAGDGPERRAVVRMVSVARLVPFKGLTHLVEACRLLVARGYDLRCEIIGDGPLRADLEGQIAAASLGGHVVLRGARPQDEVRQALDGASLFVLPSIDAGHGDMEGVPVSLMEAMATGVPVVATRAGAVPELVEDGVTGLLVNPGDAEALAAAVARLAGDDMLAGRLGMEGRARARRDFDLRRNVRVLHELLCAATGAALVAELGAETEIA
jgi:colanic acid/amylovoran biosynthesis glycosyltransferase